MLSQLREIAVQARRIRDLLNKDLESVTDGGTGAKAAVTRAQRRWDISRQDIRRKGVERNEKLATGAESWIAQTRTMVGREDFAEEAADKLKEVLSKTRLILCTNSMLSSLRRMWDSTCNNQINVVAWLLDEAGATSESSCAQGFALRPKVVCLLGDHKQLPPHVNIPSKALVNTNMDRSLMERLINGGAPCTPLTVQYRMHPDMCRISSELFYAGTLKTAEALSRSPPLGMGAACLYDCRGNEERTGTSGSWMNKAEARWAVRLAKWMANDCPDRTIGILSGYSGQTRLVRNMVAEEGLSAKVQAATVDSSQGGEFDLLIFCTVRSNDRPSIGFCGDARRINGAISRAKHSLAISGDAATMCTDHNWATIWNNCTPLGEDSLPEDYAASPDEKTEQEVGEGSFVCSGGAQSGDSAPKLNKGAIKRRVARRVSWNEEVTVHYFNPKRRIRPRTKQKHVVTCRVSRYNTVEENHVNEADGRLFDDLLEGGAHEMVPKGTVEVILTAQEQCEEIVGMTSPSHGATGPEMREAVRSVLGISESEDGAGGVNFMNDELQEGRVGDTIYIPGTLPEHKLVNLGEPGNKDRETVARFGDRFIAWEDGSMISKVGMPLRQIGNDDGANVTADEVLNWALRQDGTTFSELRGDDESGTRCGQFGTRGQGARARTCMVE